MERIPFFLTDSLMINDVEAVCSHILSYTKDPFSCEGLKAFIDRSPSDAIFYLDSRLNIVGDGDKEDAEYAWVDTGLKDRSKDPILISFARVGRKYIGYFVGTPAWLMSYIMKKNDIVGDKDALCEQFMKDYVVCEGERKKSGITVDYELDSPGTAITIKKRSFVDADDDDEEYDSAADVVARDVEPLLMVNPFTSFNGLVRYLNVMGSRLYQLREEKKTNYYVDNKKGDCIANTGLLTKYGTDVYIMFGIHIKKELFLPKQILLSKQDWLKAGYTKEQCAIELEPISFADGEKSFTVDIDDIDISLPSLRHIIEDRKDRFPEEMQNLSSAEITTKIKNELELALRVQKIDPTYIKPSYSGRTRGISWLIPFHFGENFLSSPQAVLVAIKNENFYNIVTLLPYDNAVKDKITALALYGGTW